jgi:predicted PurR-regulated permease PerM
LSAPDRAADRPAGVRTVALVTLAVIAAVAALYLARDFFIPIAVALLFNALLRPPVRWLERLRVPAPVGAAVVVLAFVGVLVWGTVALAGPVQRWIDEAPKDFATAQTKLRSVRRSLTKITHAAQQVEKAASAEEPAGAPAPIPAPAGPGLAARLFGTTTAFVAGLVEVLLLAYLLLAVGTLFLRKLRRIVSREEKAVARTIVSEIKVVIERYVLVTVAINVVQGTLVGLVLWALGMPNPVLWGVATLFLEAIPYLGATVMVLALSLAAFATFDGVGRILLVPGAYLAITTLQNNVVSPVAYGRGLKLNPVAVLIAVMFWWFLWGVPGAFLAVPIVAAARIIAERTEGLAALGEFLGA